ncbi:hypothetical protein RVIR1_05090 [Candidatus Rickettsiella viridis]|uniref:Uncharacterized protein n=2 Tax=Candidatus Rickettsiella viridis TaxID=676208 RepID=A0A2Z5UU71_9COXI|nr:hypothetical protein RVIR1_05090 [Candidatus Rickettsiella viridis]
MLAAEEAIARFEQEHSRAMYQAFVERVPVEHQLTNETFDKHSFCEEEEDALPEPPYLAFKIAFVEARYDLKCAEQTLKSLRDSYRKEKSLELAANAKGKGDEAYKRFVGYREKEFYPALQYYKDARKAYFKAFIARQFNWLKHFVHTIKEICVRFIIKPIKNSWKSFNRPVYFVSEVSYDRETACIVEEKQNDKQEQLFKTLHSTLEKMQNGVENKKETTEEAKPVPEIEIVADGIRYRQR